MRLLLTRPSADSAALAQTLADLGHEIIAAPLLAIEARHDVELSLDHVQALLATSANGVRALARVSARRDVPLFAVGEATARAAVAAGFVTVTTAAGDGAALAARVREALDPRAGRLVHVAGTVSAGDLAGTLTPAGFEVERAVLYDAVPVRVLPAVVRTALSKRELDGVLLYSPRTARTFASLVRAAGLVPAMTTLAAYCLSPAVASALEDLAFAHIAVAPRPDEASLLALLGP